MEINDGGIWRTSQKVYVADGGVWRQAAKAYTADGGVWRNDTTLGSQPKLTSWTVAADPDYPHSGIRFTYGTVDNGTAAYPIVTVSNSATGAIYTAKASTGGFYTWRDTTNGHPRPNQQYTITVSENNGTTTAPRPDLGTSITLPQLPAPSNLQVVTTGYSDGSPQIRVTWNSQHTLGVRQYGVSVLKQTVDGQATGQQPTAAFPTTNSYTFSGTPGAQYKIDVAGILYAGVAGSIASTTYYQSRDYTVGFDPSYIVNPVYSRTWSTGKRLWRSIATRNHGDKFNEHGIQHTSFFYWPDEVNGPYGAVVDAINKGASIDSVWLELECTLIGHESPLGVFAQRHQHRTFTPLASDVAPTFTTTPPVKIGEPSLGRKWYVLPVEWGLPLLFGDGITIGNRSITPSQGPRTYLEFTPTLTITGRLSFAMR